MKKIGDDKKTIGVIELVILASGSEERLNPVQMPRYAKDEKRR